MSALGQKQTSDSRLLVSAIHPKADIRQSDFDVRLVPKADIPHCGRMLLFDHVVGNFIDGIFTVERSAMTAGVSVRDRRSKNFMQSGRQHSGGMQ
jgi:hypothetical protein